MRTAIFTRFLATALVASLTACTLAGAGGLPTGLARGSSQVRGSLLGANSKIKHIVIVVQENRSFDNIFAGYPGAASATFGKTHEGAIIPLRPVSFVDTADPSLDLGHSLLNSRSDWDDGKMDGFDTVENNNSVPAGDYPYAFLERSQVAPYWAMANQYVLADRMFPTEWGASFTAHLDLIGGTTLLYPNVAVADNPTALPWGCDAPPGTVTSTWNSYHQVDVDAGPFPCYNFVSLAAPLDVAGISWKYYAPAITDAYESGTSWTAFDAISSVRYTQKDWQNVSSPQTNILTDVSGGALPGVSWVIPDYADSDHAGSTSDTGPSWVATIVDAIGHSKYWDSTAIVVVWDDWGGWYDNVPPPQLDFAGLSIRVPCIIISPYAKRHYVSHTQYEFGSVLKFVEQTFALSSLGTTDVRANSLADSFDFTRPARAFTSISAPYPPSYFLKRKPSMRAPDDE
jgi:phospholipase C